MLYNFNDQAFEANSRTIGASAGQEVSLGGLKSQSCFQPDEDQVTLDISVLNQEVSAKGCGRVPSNVETAEMYGWRQLLGVAAIIGLVNLKWIWCASPEVRSPLARTSLTPLTLLKQGLTRPGSMWTL